MSEPVRFRSTFKSVPVEIEDRKGTVTNYIIREMTGQEKAQYFQRARSKSHIADNGDVIVEDYDGMFTDLLTLCMTTVDGQYVKKEVIDKWPASTLSGLIKEAQKLNALRAKDAEAMIEEAKNG